MARESSRARPPRSSRRRPAAAGRPPVGAAGSARRPAAVRRRDGTGAGAARSAPVRDRLIESRLTPNAISVCGLALNLAAAGLVVGRSFVAAGLVFVVGSIMDTLDGHYSRISGKGTPFGAFLDSTLDRIEEGIVLTTVAAYFSSQGNDGAVAAVVLAVLASLMVSYTRARAEALGVQCKVGLATRPVRVTILAIGLVFAGLGVLAPAVYVLAALAIVTVAQRTLHVRRALRERPPASPGASGDAL